MNDRISFDDTSIAFKSKADADLRKAYLLFLSMNNNNLVKVGTAAIKLGLSLRLPIKGIIKATMFSHFCGGETIDDSKGVVKQLSQYGIGAILDYSVEGEKSEEGFESTAREILKTIDAAQNSKDIPFSVFKMSGVGSVELLEKVQNKEKLSDQQRIQFNNLKSRVEVLCKAAYDKRVRLLIDAEESWIQDAIDEIVYEMMKKYNKEQPIVFNTYQMYRWDMLKNLKDAFRLAVANGFYLGVKLVRGAYMEKEREIAEQQGKPDPIQQNKANTDRDYDEALRFCCDHLEKICLVSGTHNEASNYLLISLMKQKNITENNDCIYFVQLYGMSDHISYNLADAGYNVAKYLPYGPVEKVMPYLFRRATENTSIKGQSSREFRLIEKEFKRRKGKS